MLGSPWLPHSCHLDQLNIQETGYGISLAPGLALSFAAFGRPIASKVDCSSGRFSRCQILTFGGN